MMMSVTVNNYSLLNKQSAFDYATKLLHRKFGSWFSVLPVNCGRHLLLRPQSNDAPVFYCLFKREWMYEFNKVFPKFVRENPEYKGMAESINKEWLDYSIRAGATYLLYIYPDRGIYVVPPLLVKKFVEKNNLIRTQLRSNDYLIPDGQKSVERVNELTYCFPIKLLTKLEVNL
jgi:hypothetical protein